MEQAGRWLFTHHYYVFDKSWLKHANKVTLYIMCRNMKQWWSVYSKTHYVLIHNRAHQRVSPQEQGDQLCFEVVAGLPCNEICISMKSEREIKSETDSWRGFFFFFFLKTCLAEHSYYESINPHYDTLLFHSFTTRCQSSNGNITVTVFKSHIQYLLLYQLQLQRNVNKPYKPCRALTPCHCTAGFILACVRQHMARAWHSCLSFS